MKQVRKARPPIQRRSPQRYLLFQRPLMSYGLSPRWRSSYYKQSERYIEKHFGGVRGVVELYPYMDADFPWGGGPWSYRRPTGSGAERNIGFHTLALSTRAGTANR